MTKYTIPIILAALLAGFLIFAHRRTHTAQIAPPSPITAPQEQALQEAKKEAEAAAVKEAAEKSATKKAAEKAAAKKAADEAAARKAAEDAAAKKAADEAAARKAADEAAVKNQGQIGQIWSSDSQKNCAQCCADMGGAWSWGPQTGNCTDTKSCQTKWGCCSKDWPGNWQSIPSCSGASLPGYDRRQLLGRFRCAAQ